MQSSDCSSAMTESANSVCQGMENITFPEVEIDPTCNEMNFYQRLAPNTLCLRSYVEPVRDVLVNEGCQGEADSTIGGCIANEAGQYCVNFFGSAAPFLVAQETCTDTSTCDPPCIAALNSLNSAAGCCLNAQFNGTDTPDFLSFEFWNRCDLTPPGMCEPRLTPARSTPNATPAGNYAPALRAPGMTIGSAAGLVMMALKVLH